MSSITPPEGINQIVYKTNRGEVFHNSPECELLLSGQNMAYEAGMEIHPINPISYEGVAEIGACSWCCGYFYYLKGEAKYISVNLNSTIEMVQLIAKRPLGFGNYEYRIRKEGSGEELVIRKNQINF